MCTAEDVCVAGGLKAVSMCVVSVYIKMQLTSWVAVFDGKRLIRDTKYLNTPRNKIILPTLQ